MLGGGLGDGGVGYGVGGGLAVFVACADEVAEEGVRFQGLGFELGVELAAEKPGVLFGGELDNFDVGGVWGGAGEAEAGADEEGFVFAVELVAMAVALGDFEWCRRLGQRASRG